MQVTVQSLQPWAWPASSVVIYYVIAVVLLTVAVSAFAIAAAVKVGRRDPHLRGSTAARIPDDSDHQLPCQPSVDRVAVSPPVSRQQLVREPAGTCRPTRPRTVLIGQTRGVFLAASVWGGYWGGHISIGGGENSG